MILQYLSSLGRKKIILASSSPRRKEILEKIGLNLTIVPSTFEENLDPSNFSHPSDFVIATARGKTEEVAKRLSSSNSPPDLVIGADTCISLGGQVYGKPKDREDALSMLNKFSGTSHNVLTGVCVMVQRGTTWQEISFSEATSVQFAELSADDVNAYIDTGEPFDKAGGYGIQGLGGMLVEGIHGDYYNVMGFPLHRFCLHLATVLSE
ncbi:probable bifunctional dTTP/UTP pyrophosphatase/methyltransferase protein [Homarus americanus]|uniref:Bifunctional dTTP/UTP pyrophosphatase/methyltransferase protein-like n=1 Tax=Homarus americanus TaxID=6706 RepID=A0A8J5MPI3_HOMAM|nr:probable bifunctional dTTP/UTP pyrophosphatase/methyltransferase protein [Homarus americanus]KAG7158900.1 bifunctional dTTP/UTP pyrophosphatase/methyltransferase protein-like [Homarus americanus]